MHIFLPGVSNLIKRSGFRVLALVNGITLPSAPALTEAGTIQHVSLFVTLMKCVIHVISDVVDNALISELGVGDTRPFPTTIADTCAPHHVAHVVLLIPLISNAIHHPFISCTDFLVGSHGAESKLLVRVIVLGGSTPFHVVSPALRSTVSVVVVVV